MASLRAAAGRTPIAPWFAMGFDYPRGFYKKKPAIPTRGDNGFL